MGLYRAGVAKHQTKYSEYKYFMTVFMAVSLKVEKIIPEESFYLVNIIAQWHYIGILVSKHPDANIT